MAIEKSTYQEVCNVTGMLIEKYQDFFKNDLFSNDTIKAVENLIKQLGDDKNGKWHDVIESSDMT